MGAMANKSIVTFASSSDTSYVDGSFGGGDLTSMTTRSPGGPEVGVDPNDMFSYDKLGTYCDEVQEKIHQVAATWRDIQGNHSQGSLTKQPRVYEVWPHVGGTVEQSPGVKFRLGGRILTGPSIDRKHVALAWVYIIYPPALFLLICTEDLMNNNPWLPVWVAVACLSSIGSMFLTSCTDPGIIPKPLLQALVEGLEEQVAQAFGCSVTDINTNQPDYSSLVNLQSMGFGACRFCRMIVPPRAKHCRDCNNCVLRNDHHCPFVNNCIGQRNYPFYCIFLVCATCLGVSVCTGCVFWWHFCSAAYSHEMTIVLGLFVGLPAVIGLVTVSSLGMFHLFLIVRGRTTREVRTGRVVGGATLFGKRGRSLISGRWLLRLPPASA